MEDDELISDTESLIVDNPDSPGSVNADAEAIEVPAVKVEPKPKRIVRNPQPKLDADRLRGPRGLIVLRDCFKNVHFKGKGHEKEDLDEVMSRLEQWTHRLFPKFTFDDTLARIEKLGHKATVANYVKRIRLDMVDEDVRETNDDAVLENDTPMDNDTNSFDDILNQPLRLDSASQQPPQQITLTDEQRERMIRNRLLAEERRMAREKSRAEQERVSSSDTQ